MEDVRGVIFIILCCIVSNSCYAPKKYNRNEEIGSIKVVENRNKTDKGAFEIVWVDNRDNEHITYAADTLIYKLGYRMPSIIKQ